MESSTSHHCATITTIHPQNSFSSYKTETLYLLNNNCPFSLLLASANHHSTFCLYEFDHCWYRICNSQGSLAEQNRLCTYNYRHKDRDREELAYTVMEAEKSEDLQLASWRLKRVDNIVSVWKPEGLQPKKSWCFSWNPKAGKYWCPGSRSQMGRILS